jgi:hypothetical protein
VPTVATDADVERRVRGALLDHAHPGGLPDRLLVESLELGRASVRRRRRQAAAIAAATIALVVALTVAAVRQDDTGRPEPASPAPSTSAEPPTTTAGIWAPSLPRGARAEVPYLVGTTVVQPDGSRVEVPGTEASLVGLSVAGAVLLVGTEVQQPYSFSTRYVLVRPSGEVQDLPVSTLVADGAQGAVVSPDGREFTGGGAILDLTDLSIVGEVPEEADLLVAWTPVGIVYFVHGGQYVLWPVDGAPIPLAADPGVFGHGSDVAMDACSNVVRLAADGTTSPVSPHCLGSLWAVSPSGRWAITPDLELVDVSTGAARSLADRSIVAVHRYDRVWWNGDDSVLFPAGDWLVRCEIETAACEQVAGPLTSLSLP